MTKLGAALKRHWPAEPGQKGTASTAGHGTSRHYLRSGASGSPEGHVGGAPQLPTRGGLRSSAGSRFRHVALTSRHSGSSCSSRASISAENASCSLFREPQTMPVAYCSAFPDETSKTTSTCLPGSWWVSILIFLPMSTGFFGSARFTSQGPSSTDPIILNRSRLPFSSASTNLCQLRPCGPSPRSHSAAGSTAPVMMTWYGGKTQFKTTRNLSSPEVLW
mmetsp:Transcript_4687/g.12582  ORF Transcript_4687/g.12582 Transcript_4687/m.12582 type:complete len:220 (+) Transcript_4687:46-705(+)